MYFPYVLSYFLLTIAFAELIMSQSQAQKHQEDSRHKLLLPYLGYLTYYRIMYNSSNPCKAKYHY
jgi:hypothetical protein